ASTDIELDVEQIRRWAHKHTDHVTLVRVPGALHDVTMTRKEVRESAFDEISRWLDAYVGA
ncbi:MAG: alpha/beta hydrolase, partial [Nocardioidaceae bacterium]|nr:alpha/beta hydrolase [Nocardioidaceae bacterium]